MLAQLAAEDVGHVLQRRGLVGGGDEEPDEGEGQGVEAGEDAEELAVAPVDAEGDEEGEEAGAGEVPEGGPRHADFAPFVGEYLVGDEAGTGSAVCVLVWKAMGQGVEGQIDGQCGELEDGVAQIEHGDGSEGAMVIPLRSIRKGWPPPRQSKRA